LQLQDLIAAGQQHTYRLQYNYVCFLFNTRKAAVKSFQFQDAGKVTTCYSFFFENAGELRFIVL
jgi:hypothetical protein